MEKLTVSQCVSSDYCQGWNDAVEKADGEYDSLYAKLTAVCAELEELQNSQAEVKADAVREATKYVFLTMNMHPKVYDNLLKHADQLEQGK